jgi:hypothetical protein
MNGALSLVGAFFIIFGGFIYAAIQMINYEKKWNDEEDDD